MKRGAGAGEGGYALLMFVVTLTLVMAAVIGLTLAFASAPERSEADTQWVNAAAAAITSWYTANPLAMDGAANPVLPGAGALGQRLLTVAGVAPAMRAQVIIGPLVNAGTFRYRQITVWIPKASVSNGTAFSPAVAEAWSTVSGYPIEAQLALESQNRLDGIANALAAMFAVQMAAAPSHDVLANYFEPPSCGAGAGENPEMGCATAPTPAAQMGLAQAIADAGPWTDAWGDPIETCNTSSCGGNDTVPPYSVGLSATNPWGNQENAMAVEPLGS
ncbi:MAG: hypothetical protein ACYDHY_09805 [Acidiferrobacterales bacterium]